VPEGDTIHHAANRIRPVLEGQVPDEIRTPHPRFGRDRWPERLAGAAVRSVEARGKHLFIRFEGGMAIHSHLRMTGAWKVTARGRPLPLRAWLVIERGDRAVVQVGGPVLELMTEGRTRFDQVLAGLGEDVVARSGFDIDRYLGRLRADDPTRPIGDALLDQSVVAGLGTIWRSEACWHAQLDPWRATGKVGDDEALAAVMLVRPLMQRSAAGGFKRELLRCYGHAGRPCPRCATPIERTSQGDNNRRLYWCPGCQR